VNLKATCVSEGRAMSALMGATREGASSVKTRCVTDVGRVEGLMRYVGPWIVRYVMLGESEVGE